MSEPGGWIPDEATLAAANLTRFLAWLAETGRGQFADYHELLGKSVADIEWFWDAVFSYFDVQADSPPPLGAGQPFHAGRRVVSRCHAELRHRGLPACHRRRPALIVVGEDGSSEWSWARLQRETAAFAAYLRNLGVQPGDSVVGYLPNIGEAVVAALAAASVGAVWAVCNQDLAVDGVVARLGQLEPAVLVASDGSVYDGKRIDRREELAEIRRALPTLRATVVVPRLGLDPQRDTRHGPRAGGSGIGCRPGHYAGPLRAPAVGDVLVGNHRQAEGHRARTRRGAAGAPEILDPATGPAPRRSLPVVLVAPAG